MGVLMAVWKRSDWNDIIQRVNDLSANPDEGCDPLPPLPEVGEKHLWSKDDISQVRERLQEICDENRFSATLRLWAQDVVDEINAAIAAGWCNCQNCESEERTVILNEHEIPVVRRDFECVGLPPFGAGVPLFGDVPPPPAEPFDYLSVASTIQGKPNQRGGVSLLYQVVDPDNVVTQQRGIGSATFHCDGSLKNLHRDVFIGEVGSGPWDFLTIRNFDTYAWRRAGELYCPFFFYWVDYFYTYCGDSGVCNQSPKARYLAQSIGNGSVQTVPPQPKPPPDWEAGSPGHLAAIQSQNAAAIDASGYKQRWVARVTNFAGCKKCCPDGKGFLGVDCGFED